MGSDPYKYIHANITQEHIHQVLDDRKDDILFNFYSQYSQRNGYLTKELFNRIIRLDDEEISDNLFSIFEYNKGKMYFSELRNFYVAFSNKSLRHILLSFLILGKTDKLELKAYINNLSKFVSLDDKFVILYENRIMQSMLYKEEKSGFINWNYFGFKSKSNDGYISKKLFLDFLFKNSKFKFSFFERVKPSSEIYRQKNNSEKHYVCDCLKQYLNINRNDLFNKMEQPFLYDKLVNKGHLSFDNLEKMFDEYQVNKKLVSIIINYLKIDTMKNSINFIDFKNLMFNIYSDQSHSKKKTFLFKMILTICNQKISIKASQLIKILQIDNKDCKLEGNINQNDFENMKDIIVNNEIETFIGFMENIVLIPFIRYNLIATTQEIEKKVINFILNKKTAEEYLIDNFDKNNKFYPINIEFWNELTSDINEGELKINNYLIADKDEIFYINDNNDIQEVKNVENENKISTTKVEENQELKKSQKKEEIKVVKKETIKAKLKKDVIYGKDYIIICGEIFNKIYQYFEFDYLIQLEKTIIYSESKTQQKSKDNKNKNIDKKSQETETKTAKIKEKQNKGNIFIFTNDKNYIIENFNKLAVDDKNKTYSKEEMFQISQRIEFFYLKKIEEKLITSDEIEEKGETEEIGETQDLEEKDFNEGKLIINKEKNYLRKKETKDDSIKEYIVDFYPIKYLQLSFDYIINTVGRKFEELEEEKYNSITGEEKNRLNKEIKAKKKNRQNRLNEYQEKYEQIKELFEERSIDKNLANEKLNILKEQYKDLFEKELNLNKTDFFSILNMLKNEILNNRLNYLRKTWKYITTHDIKNSIIKSYDKLNQNNFNLIFYTLDNKCFFKNKKIPINEINDDFILIIIDKKNKEGKTGLSLLEDNEKKSINKNYTDKINTQSKNIDILSEEELKKIKDEQNEREKLKRQKEKEEKDKLDQLEKEKKKANQKIVHPPYGIPNFGNTCYFNSVNQIILNLPIMQKLFSDKNIKYMINKENKFGYKGKLISAFIPLYELYLYQIEDNVNYLKSLVGKFNETFNNREQQDAHEYLNFILEGLHEELNLKTSKIYIEDNDENYKYNTEDELGNIAWANNLRRNVSFIDSIFMFQLKSNLTCKKCGNKKFNFESSYIFNLPLSLCKMVTVRINLYRLPFKYKVYYSKINKDFELYSKNEENINKNITEILCDYYSVKLNYEQKKEQAVHVFLEFDYEREKCIGDIIKLVRKISLLELEPENIEISMDNPDIKEYKINHYTELIAYFSDKNKIIKNDMILDSFADTNDRIQINVYEVLNSNGFNLINKNYIKNQNFNIYSYKFLKSNISSIKIFKQKIDNTNYFIDKSKQASSTPTPELRDKIKINNILSINDKLLYIENNSKDLNNKIDIVYEQIIPIVHYRRDLNDASITIFLDFYHQYMRDFPIQFLLLNNNTSNKFSSRDLYNYIWDYNSLYMNHPNKKTDNFWFNINPDTKEKYKKCYPFVIRIVKQNKKYSQPFKCSKCHWYNFCIGCVLSPDISDVHFESDDIIFVDWCNSLVKEEIDSQNFYFKKFTKEEITISIESAVKNDKDSKYQSIQDCFDLFFEKENLEDPLSCRICKGPQYFIKNYEINKLPYVLILSLKRFKYNENNNFKLKQLITYPIDNFKLKDKIYNLFGVIYHYGNINSGHYVCVIKKDNKWILCDDNVISEVESKRVMNSNAYILFYISEDSINTYSYYNCMQSLLQHINMDNKSKKDNLFKDNNFFKGEPIKVESKGNGYVVEDYIEDFINEDVKINSDKNEDKDTVTDKNENENSKKDGKVKVKFESIKEMEFIDKNNIEKLILVDEQKKN